MKNYYYRVTAKVLEGGAWAYYRLGYTSNKWAFQRASGWPMKALIFTKILRRTA
jgi:hypothetical protein